MSRRDRTYDPRKAMLRIGDHEMPLASVMAFASSAVVVEGVDQHGAPVTETMTVRPVAWWNNLRRAWMVNGPDGQPVLVDPQPPPPVFATGISFPDVPPAVKVTA